MNLKEALQALIDGKKIRPTWWEKGYYIYLKDNEIINENGNTVLLGNPGNSYEIYEEPKPKRKFYRRKWIASKFGRDYETTWCYSKEKFDELYSSAFWTERSKEWEEREED